MTSSIGTRAGAQEKPRGPLNKVQGVVGRLAPAAPALCAGLAAASGAASLPSDRDPAALRRTAAAAAAAPLLPGQAQCVDLTEMEEERRPASARLPGEKSNDEGGAAEVTMSVIQPPAAHSSTPCLARMPSDSVAWVQPSATAAAAAGATTSMDNARHVVGIEDRQGGAGGGTHMAAGCNSGQPDPVPVQASLAAAADHAPHHPHLGAAETPGSGVVLGFKRCGVTNLLTPPDLTSPHLTSPALTYPALTLICPALP